MTAPRILVVDDEPNIRDLLVTSLRFAGYQVRAVSNGAQTISAVLEEEPDLIILDVMLPDMNGFSVTKRLRGAGDVQEGDAWEDEEEHTVRGVHGTSMS